MPIPSLPHPLRSSFDPVLRGCASRDEERKSARTDRARARAGYYHIIRHSPPPSSRHLAFLPLSAAFLFTLCSQTSDLPSPNRQLAQAQRPRRLLPFRVVGLHLPQLLPKRPVA